tara:strand:- start:256 stop:528 length:273 start_codon:yes stop_codon:yes gene_type:complete
MVVQFLGLAGSTWTAIGTFAVGSAIVIGTAYSMYQGHRQTKEFEQQRKLSEEFRAEDTALLKEQARTNLIIAIIGIAISILTIYFMFIRK